MPSRDWKFRIQDIVDSIDKIKIYLDQIDYENFKKNNLLIDAVIRNFEIIGEASNHLPENIRSSNPDIPWKQMRGIRNILLHEYFGVDLETVWYTATIHLPSLNEKLIAILNSDSSK